MVRLLRRLLKALAAMMSRRGRGQGPGGTPRRDDHEVYPLW